ncbi:alpha,alpha-trehalose-phosphate synthase 1 [Uncinocarpus reesii 1704]|uniref:Alpha,alpha-trehalose-phosphate synthase 1 n=1 Tax=Uncinocarpus reesii (strain UAMH 1704) TaxID=336963 RepID=C4JSK2_UNCRE|nr:alpha,alpha-trehalose-phosphate synthase 1 [Uncinocarpus reesii 1704]EEP80599.1 alpha,alpha-trehalose-phosphate synthase 1 [Uncinocarpus reesii 1704]
MPAFDSPPREDPRLLLVSNRLPITIKRSDDGKYDSSMSSGGLPVVPGYCIDPDKFSEGLKKEKVQKRIAQLEQKFQGVKLMVGVDRLDYIKGVPQKLHALEVFLTDHPEWIGKVVLVQVAVPSRQDVEEYQNLRAVVNELVGRINGKFGSCPPRFPLSSRYGHGINTRALGTVEFMPIHFMHKSVNFDELIALYAVSDACIVSSTRDGMNLVSYEYIATQHKRHAAYQEAVTMNDEQRALNYSKLEKYVHKFTSAFWGQSFVSELTRISAHGEKKLLLRRSSLAANAAEVAINGDADL